MIMLRLVVAHVYRLGAPFATPHVVEVGALYRPFSNTRRSIRFPMRESNDPPPSARRWSATKTPPWVWRRRRVRSRRGQAPSPSLCITPRVVRRQLKTLAAEQGRTVEDLVGEALNLLFAKYRKPEIAPVKTRRLVCL